MKEEKGIWVVTWVGDLVQMGGCTQLCTHFTLRLSVSGICSGALPTVSLGHGSDA